MKVLLFSSHVLSSLVHLWRPHDIFTVIGCRLLPLIAFNVCSSARAHLLLEHARPWHKTCSPKRVLVINNSCIGMAIWKLYYIACRMVLAFPFVCALVKLNWVIPFTSLLCTEFPNAAIAQCPRRFFCWITNVDNPIKSHLLSVYADVFSFVNLYSWTVIQLNNSIHSYVWLRTLFHL